MEVNVIEKQILINAKPENVWRVFTDPVVTRKMGGEYVSSWQAGDVISWKGLDGRKYTHGEILEIIPEELLKHKLFDLNDNDKLLSVITYKFSETNGRTLITAIEELNYIPTESQHTDASDGWDAALELVKQVAEGL